MILNLVFISKYDTQYALREVFIVYLFYTAVIDLNSDLNIPTCIPTVRRSAPYRFSVTRGIDTRCNPFKTRPKAKTEPNQVRLRSNLYLYHIFITCATIRTSMNQAWFRDKCRIILMWKLSWLFNLGFLLKILERDSYWFSIVATKDMVLRAF